MIATTAEVQTEIETEPSPITMQRIAYGDPLFRQAQQAEYEFFLGEHYTQTQGEGRMKEYKKYDRNSVFNTVYAGQDIIGVLREIHAAPHATEWPRGGRGVGLGHFVLSRVLHMSGHTPSTGFKTLDDFTLDDEWQQIIHAASPQEIIEVGTVAVAPEWRRKTLEVASRLYYQMYANRRENVEHLLIASMDDDLLVWYRELYDFHDMGPSKDYMGSPTTPVITDMDTTPEYLRERHPQFYRMCVEGIFDDGLA